MRPHFHSTNSAFISGIHCILGADAWRCFAAIMKELHGKKESSRLWTICRRRRRKILELPLVIISRPRPFNLGFNILPSNNVSNTPFFCRLRTNLAETVMDFWLRVWSNILQISAKLVQRQLQPRKGGSASTSQVRIQNPKLQGGGLIISSTMYLLSDAARRQS